MKANELMIGDWVLDGLVYAQVTSITCDGVIETTNNALSNIELVEPIPLTADFLEKNFEGKSNIFGLRTYILDENNSLEDRGSKLCLVRTCNDYIGSKFWVCDIMYVHQLQHALKLFNIEKEIEL